MPKVLCLLYHRVVPFTEDEYGIKVTPENFEKHIAFISKNFNVIRFDDDWSCLKDDSVVITFDDGYADNYTYALPILNKYNTPATFFISTENIDLKKEFWWDYLLRLCILNIEKGCFHLSDPLFEYDFNISNRNDAIDMAKSLRQLLIRESDNSVWESYFSQLEKAIDFSGGVPADDCMMSAQQIQSIAAQHLFTIGGHTVRHHSLSAMPFEQQLRECKQSVEILEDLIGKKIDSFSYPFGDYNKDTLKAMELLKIKKAATTKPASISLENVCTDTFYEVPRLVPGNITDSLLEDLIKRELNG